MVFEEIWGRITSETEIKNLTELGRIVGSTQQYVSKKKKRNEFPVRWAYTVAREHNLLTEWILTGEGPKSLKDVYEQPAAKPLSNNKYIALVVNWFEELITDDPRREEWFKCSFEDTFPKFVEWLKAREAKEERKAA